MNPSKDDTQDIGEGKSDNPIGSSNQLGLFTENRNLAQKNIQRYKDVMWERESTQVKQDSQGERKQEGTIKLPAKEGVEQEIGRAGGLEDSEGQGNEMDISELIPETEVRPRHRPCLLELDQNTINRPTDRKEGVVKAGTGTWKRIVRQQGGEQMNILDQEHDKMLTCGTKRGSQNPNHAQDRQSEMWTEKRRKGLNKENEHHKMQVEVASLEWH